MDSERDPERNRDRTADPDPARGAPLRRVSGRPDVIFHRFQDLLPTDLRTLERLPMTTVERALLDAAGALPGRTLARALDEAVAARSTSRTKLRELLDRVSPRPAVRLLAQLADPGRPSGLTESRLAERALALIAAAQLPAPHTEVELFGSRADAYWPEAALVLEIDSFGFHGLMRENFNRDRLKDRTLGRHGIAVVRWSEDDVARRGLEIIAALATTIARRRDGRSRDSPHTRPPTPGCAPR